MNDYAAGLEKQLSPEQLQIVQHAAQLADDRGFSLYLVGGVVRDLLLKRPIVDIDLVTEGDGPSLALLIAQALGGQVTSHRRFLTAKVRLPTLSIDLATARSETYAHPGALPTVRPGSLENDLARRDFTINAMALQVDPRGFGRLIDPLGGKSDLKDRLVRVLHQGSFVDDATRMLRAVRYEQRFGFRLEPDTERFLQQQVSMLSTVGPDRTRHELELILEEESPDKPLARAWQLGLLAAIHPSLKWDQGKAAMFRKARSKRRSPPFAVYLSLLLYSMSREEASDVVACLRFSKAAARAVEDTHRLKASLDALQAADLRPSAIHRMLQGYTTASVLACAVAADSPLVYDRLDLYLNKLRFVRTHLNGSDLTRMGFPPGARMGETLEALLEAKLDGEASTREDEVRLARLRLKQGG